ncbi:hypothetical protein HF086_012847 [Spodoptera exigua]|uniref:Kinesin-like protein n=1 Tax=Spodoptera exigua TaxID=7107 RepID=A0A922ML74_SPOEX|nr:hypothetical protein HF086_012847 [Spodoptera exigua]
MQTITTVGEVVKVWPERGAVQVYSPKGQDKMFTYDAAYDCTADTQTMYDEMTILCAHGIVMSDIVSLLQVRPLVASVLDGFNGCVFAYGQTGTGKTHTMEGTPDHEGIIPRAFRHIWAHIENSASPDVTHLVSCSYIELYLEDVRDLLSKDCKKLTIRGQELNGFYIPEMTSVVCKSAAEMVRVMRAGNRNRAAGRTDMNEHSSRSHAVFLVTVETAHRKTNRIRVGKLNLVDLAGSERQRKTGASAERLREASRINQALSSLGNVISALAENTIKNKPVRNEDPKDAKLREYQAEIERLRALISQRRTVDRRTRRPAKQRSQPAPSDNSEEETVSIEHENILAESTIEQEKKQTEELEQQIRALEERLVQGGGGKDLINNLNEAQLILEQRNSEITERKKREVEMQQKIELEEETTAIVTNTFATLQQEVDHKTQRLKKCLARYAGLREEMVEQREAHDAERRELEALQAALIAELRRRLLVADSFVPLAGRPAVLRARYNDDTDAWELREHTGVEPLTTRPGVAGRRRGASARPARRRAENVLDLAPLPLPSTTRLYSAPRLAPSLAGGLAPAPRKEAEVEAVAAAGRKSARGARPSTAHQRLGTAGVR